jgi:hypothetical protein
MSSTIIDSPAAEAPTPKTPDGGAHPHPRTRSARLVAVAVLAAATLGLTLAWQTAAGASGPDTPGNARTVAANQDAPVASPGAGLLAVAWELTSPSQRDAVCAQFRADPGAAWGAYSDGANDSLIATRQELSAFLGVSC